MPLDALPIDLAASPLLIAAVLAIVFAVMGAMWYLDRYGPAWARLGGARTAPA